MSTRPDWLYGASISEVVSLPDEWAGGQIHRTQEVVDRYPGTGYPRKIVVTFEVDPGE